MDFSNRSNQPELMDTELSTYEEFYTCLRELERINCWTVAYTPTLRWIKKVLNKNKQASISVLDAGSGGGDMLRRIWQRFPAFRRYLNLTGIDMNPWSKRAAQDWSAKFPIQYETVDIFNFDQSRKVDVVISGLFAHHLSNEQLVMFVRWMEQHTTMGWFINDLHRHFVPYYFIKMATHLFSKNRFIKHDAAVSVSRAFKRKDWQQILRSAEIPIENVSIKWHVPFRYCVGRLK